MGFLFSIVWGVICFYAVLIAISLIGLLLTTRVGQISALLMFLGLIRVLYVKG